jgi:hypothetical protein
LTKLPTSKDLRDQAEALANLYGQTVLTHFREKQYNSSKEFPTATLNRIGDYIQLWLKFANDVEKLELDKSVISSAVAAIAEHAKQEKIRNGPKTAFEFINGELKKKEPKKTSTSITEDLRNKFPKAMGDFRKISAGMRWRTQMEANVNLTEIDSFFKDFEDCPWFDLQTSLKENGAYSVQVFVDGKLFENIIGHIQFEEFPNITKAKTTAPSDINNLIDVLGKSK